ncbi:ABC transporter substrate-binding protein [Nonomuraea sp. NPDC001699]
MSDDGDDPGRAGTGEPAPAEVGAKWARDRRNRVFLRRALAGVLVVAVVVVLGFSVRTSRLTDESGAFGPDLAPVMDRIAAENAEVEKNHPGAYVTVVAMFPMTGSLTDIGLNRESIRHGLEGIHLAQVWRNRQPSSPPYVRVLVGSDGPDDWEPTVEAIKARTADEHIVAVTGLGASTGTTRRTVESLSGSGYAMVSAVITSDELAGVRGLARVAALNSEQARAGVVHARKVNPGLKAVVIKDLNPVDSYVKTLARFYTGSLAGRERVMELSFDSSTRFSGTVLDVIAERVCNSGANTVLYAGRSEQLPALMQALSQRDRCVRPGMTVITGDDASEMNRKADLNMWGDTRIRLFYTALAHPAGLTLPGGEVLTAIRARFAGDDPDAFPRVFPHESLGDGMAIMHHDAMFVALETVKAFAREPDVPSPQDMANMLTSGTVAVEGASGPIRIVEGGARQTKEIPILQLNPDGTSAYSGRITMTDGGPGRS